MTRKILVLVAAVAVLAACSSSKPAAVTAVKSASPSPSTATAAAYAIAMAPSIASFQEAWTRTQSDCASTGTLIACSIDKLTINTTANTLLTMISACEKVGAPGYIGPPPAVVASLLDTTKSSAQTVVDATADGSKVVGWMGDASVLSNMLLSWAPFAA